jgi:hypothetical protein
MISYNRDEKVWSNNSDYDDKNDVVLIILMIKYIAAGYRISFYHFFKHHGAISPQQLHTVRTKVFVLILLRYVLYFDLQL